mgnify:CR=1 FL=1
MLDKQIVLVSVIFSNKNELIDRYEDKYTFSIH